MAMDIVFQLDEGEKLALIKSSSMPWKYYLESYAYLFYRTAFPDRKRSNPGPSDLEQCIYLFWTGNYVIKDEIFLEFLKRLKAIRNYKVEIMNYPEFKHYLLSL